MNRQMKNRLDNWITREQPFEHTNCIVCGCGGIVGDEIEMLSNNPVCIFCMDQCTQGLVVMAPLKAMQLFKETFN